MALQEFLNQRWTPEQIGAILTNAKKLPLAEQQSLHKLLGQYEEIQFRNRCQARFQEFVKAMWPGYIPGRHLRFMADAFERVAAGTCKRLMIHMPPRSSKSKHASVYLPAWFMGKFPDKQIIQCTHKTEVAVEFGREVRNLVKSEEYGKIFPDVSLSPDSKAAGRWNTNRGGKYYAFGVDAGAAGKGADLLIIDDPHHENDILYATPEYYEKVYKWYTSGPRQRLQPRGAILLVMTRWSKQDLAGKILEKMGDRENADKWEVIEFPAILPSGDVLWPEFWTKEEVLATQASIPVYQWNAQYMSNPIAEEGALIKRDWWNIWTNPQPPHCEFVIQSWDTANTQRTRSDYSACTTWGVFTPDVENAPSCKHVILLDSFRDKLEFPDLKTKAKQKFLEWKPDTLIIEAKNSGTDLIAELRRAGLPVEDYSVSRGTRINPNDKIARTNAVTDVFRSRMVWIPNYQWARELMEEMAEFPNGDHDDRHDSAVQAIKRFRDGGFIRLAMDLNEEQDTRRRVAREYY